MTPEFPYRVYTRRDSKNNLIQVALPVAVVTLTYESIGKSFEMLIDSGAEISLIPKFAGELLGLKIHESEQLETVGGIGGEVPIVYRTVHMTLGEQKFPVTFGWVLSDDVPLIMGRKDIFPRFRIEFDEAASIVRFYSQ